ncbi:hypothetical protein CDL12_11979 [Handroanthus impetiginosus]|uniref:Uncharacterized protein n=1 Tax=Handroanthus impetiginosus TaxID=429701 RepID=A0A2G9HCW5_9LAMI|nr:hypothetical protein CDL12_11979 [Handroanthus impetiginosus]
MRIHSPQIPFLLIILIILSTPHLSNCRDINRKPNKVEIASRSRFLFSWSFSVPSSEKSRNKENESSYYRVSHRKTPGGPNPLHN